MGSPGQESRNAEDGRRRRARSLRFITWLPLVLVCAPSSLSGQIFPLKSWTEPEVDLCAAQATRLPGTPAPLPADVRARVDSLLVAGSQAAILGELITARESFRAAAELDPSNPVVAYRLARTLDEHGESAEAVAEYCRYLSLAPADATSAAVRDRIHALSANGEGPPRAPWAVAMSEGFQAFEGGRYRDAVQAFTRVIELRPDWADGYFNRALAYTADGRPEIAANDFQTYLTLAPGADDALAVREHVDRLQADAAQAAAVRMVQTRIARPGNALAQGLIIPGLGQHATGRTGLGLVVLAAAAGAVYYGMRQQEVVHTRGAYDPFGNYYEYEVTTLERPYQVHGISAAAAIAVLSAIESYIYSDRQYRRIRAAGPQLSITDREAICTTLESPEVPSLLEVASPSCHEVPARWADGATSECAADRSGPPLRSCNALSARLPRSR